MSERVASIDIGTNSARLLVAEPGTVPGTLRTLERLMTITRLGQDVDRSGVLADEAVDRTVAALETYRRERPDVVLMDLVLPHSDGLCGIARLRELDPQARVVVLSGLTDDAIRRTAREAGASAFLAKPLSTSRLIEAIETSRFGDVRMAQRLQASG